MEVCSIFGVCECVVREWGSGDSLERMPEKIKPFGGERLQWAADRDQYSWWRWNHGNATHAALRDRATQLALEKVDRMNHAVFETA